MAPKTDHHQRWSVSIGERIERAARNISAWFF